MIWDFPHARIIRWIDGDTVEVTVDQGFRQNCVQTLRLMGSELGVNTRELSDKDSRLRELANRAVAAVNNMAPPGSAVMLRTAKPQVPQDGFGRFLAQVVMRDGRNVGDVLLEMGLAVPYVRKR